MTYYWTFRLDLIFITNTVTNIMVKSLYLFLAILKGILIKTEFWVRDYKYFQDFSAN